MFDTLSETAAYYATGGGDRHEIIYKAFDTKLAEDRALWTAFDKGDGFGEHAFGWNWKLLVDTMPNDFKFLEIGVYKGRVMAFVDILARRSGKVAHIYGIVLRLTVAAKPMVSSLSFKFKILNPIHSMCYSF
jgi:predicted aminopeptidase